MPLYNADVQAGGWPAPVTALADAMRAADGVIIVTPEYNYSCPGILQERHRLGVAGASPDQPFANKPMALLSASQGPLGGQAGCSVASAR